MINNPIYCAIDTSDTEQAIALIEKIRPFIGGIKLGLEFYTHCGIEGVNKIKELGLPMFIDLKLFDIPNTTKSALQGILASEPELTTLHISGGSEMLRDCVDIRDSNKSKTKLIGVTVLTSFDENGINTVGNGIGHDIELVIDNDNANSIVLNDYYVADLNTYKSGKINFELNDIDPGEHNLKIKVWDNYNCLLYTSPSPRD